MTIMSYGDLRNRGLARSRIEKLVEEGALLHLRRGFYARPEIPPEIAAAVRRGGVLTCVSALRIRGLWTLPDERSHIRVPSGTRVAAAPNQRIHWSKQGVDLSAGVDSTADSIDHVAACLDLRAAVIVIDSALNRNEITPAALHVTLQASPRGRRILAMVDERAESGLETIARLALRRLRVKVRSQVVIPSVGRVDLLIGDRLILELDGRDAHADFERDRTRDRAAVVAGYVVMRAGYHRVLHEWAGIEAEILAVIRREEHLWRVPHERLGHPARRHRRTAPPESRT